MQTGGKATYITLGLLGIDQKMFFFYLLYLHTYYIKFLKSGPTLKIVISKLYLRVYSSICASVPRP